jgi:carbamoyltransferase
VRILGIGTHVTCGSALLEDGRIVAAVNDERLVREKMVFGFPRESIRKVLELGGIAPGDLDYVAVATQRQHLIDKYVDFRQGKFRLKRGFWKQAFFVVGSRMSGLINRLPFLEKVYYLLRQPFFIHRRARSRRILREELGITCPVVFMDHHFCHATSAHYSSGYEDAMVVTLDSAGDGLSSRVYSVAGSDFESLQQVSSYNSPCAFYSYVTQVCGFKAGKHEGKITGLSAHGKPIYRDLFRSWIRHENGTFKNIGGVFFYSGLRALEEGLPEGWTREDLSATIQKYSEEMVVEYVRHWLRRSGKRNVALAGGIFANVRINQKIHEIEGVDSVFVHPGMSDEGMGLGAALALYYTLPGTSEPKLCMDHVYLGPEFGDEEIRKELEAEELEFEHHENVEKEIAKLLTEGYVVARFNGRMEYGPRALGNRSILYQPTDRSVNDWLNTCLKRTEFMPFAPSTLMEDAEQCYVGVEGARNTARFMTITFDCTDWMKERCHGVVHIDGTARPQLVSREDNESYYRIISEFKKLTGLGTIINTSFNIHEEPIVCTPGDAIRAFKVGHLDYLAIGSFLVKSKHPITHPLYPVEHRAGVAEPG